MIRSTLAETRASRGRKGLLHSRFLDTPCYS
jgi:hypothetical protein